MAENIGAWLHDGSDIATGAESRELVQPRMLAKPVVMVHEAIQQI
jgi:hypothetical protein